MYHVIQKSEHVLQKSEHNTCTRPLNKAEKHESERLREKTHTKTDSHTRRRSKSCTMLYYNCLFVQPPHMPAA